MDREELVRELLISIEGPNIRPALKRTPMRVARSYDEMLDGYGIDIEKLLTSFDGDEGKDQIVAMRDIQAWSLCEHHLLPFEITAHVAYLPTDKVVGASKLERLVVAHAHRLQLQERITKNVANDLMRYLKPEGVAVIIFGKHLCMRCRGVKSSSSTMVTSVMLGQFRLEKTLRMEVLSLLGLRP